MNTLLVIGIIFLFVMPFASGKVSLRWNPRFKDPWSDPDWNDFDKNSWQVSVGEHFHNIIALQLINDTTGKIVDYGGKVSTRAVSHLFTQTKNESYNSGDWYSGSLCMHDTPLAKNYMIAELAQYKFPNCVGYLNNQTIWWWGSANGHMFLKDMFFNEDYTLNGDQRYINIYINSQKLEQDEVAVYTPNIPFLSVEYKPYRIELAQPLPTSVVANTPFQVKLKILNTNGQIITSSINAHLELMIQVSYVHKWFSRKGGLWLTQTDAVLGGPEVTTSVTNDKVIFANFVKGIADVTMQIEDIYDSLELNFTSKFHVHNYRRYPDSEWFPYKGNGMVLSYTFFQTYGNYLTDPRSNETHIKYQHFENDTTYFKAVKIANITVTAQTPVKFQIVPSSLAKLRSVQKVYRTFEAPMEVELLDGNNNRVTSGPDSEVEVTVSSDVVGTQFSSDSSFKLHRGAGTFSGAIVLNITSTRVKFSVATSAGSMETDFTNYFAVQEIISFGMQASLHEHNAFGASKLYYAMNETGPLAGIGDFNLFCDTKKGKDMLDWFDFERKLKFSHGAETVEVAFVIGPSKEEDTTLYAGIAAAYNIPIYNYKSTKSIYSDKTKFPNFIRLQYSDQYQYSLFCNFLKSRKLNKLMIISTLDQPTPNEFVDYAATFGIEYSTVIFPIVLDNNTDLTAFQLDEFFKEFSSTKLKTVVSFVEGHALNYMVSEVTKRKLTRENGYLWMGTGQMYNDFPYENDGRCQGITNHTCVEAFKGTMIFQPYYPMHGFESKNWMLFKSLYAGYVHWKHNYGPSNEPLPTDEDTLKHIALAQDSMQLMAHSWTQLSIEKRTLNLENMLEKAAASPIERPISGDSVLFDKNFDRTNYTACLMQLDGAVGETGKKQVLKKKKLLKLGENVTSYNILADNTIIEIPFTGQSLIYSDVPNSVKNILSVKTINGSFNDKDELDGTLQIIVRTESVPPAFHCTGGCGGNRLSLDDQRLWENGECVKHETCRCKIDSLTGNPAYSGRNCGAAVCVGCLHGTCREPNNCTCDPGYVNSPNKTDCGLATCLAYGCNENFGECTAADICKCQPGYYSKDCSRKCDCGDGGRCSDGESGNGQCTCSSAYTGNKCATRIAVIAAPTAVAALIVLVLLFLIGRQKYKQLEIKAQLMSTEWKADWDSIIVCRRKNESGVISLTSMTSMMSAKSGNDDDDDDDDDDEEVQIVCRNQGIWNERDIVVKMIRKEEVDLTEGLRWEIKEMRDVKHPNLCLFVGACIDTNHVCILNEVCGKGSLQDILSNDDIDLGWDFRYSMLKDICRGMQYLHNTEIASHGRLKSSNCLVDNRWTVKLSDYGLKIFKSNQEGVRVFDKESGEGVTLPLSEELDLCDYHNLLWTSPEIIATGVSHPDHVGYGTKEGDVYSFAMVMVEICTRRYPFHEIDELDPDEIVHMVGRRRSYKKGLPLTQCLDEENIPIMCLRPQISEDELPRDDDQAKAMYKLIGECWNQHASCRPKFGKCLKLLNVISPHCGELMDNLIALMEQYTISLESIVAERTFDLVAEKEKGDLLLSKMLPPLIAEELKLGKNPKPEYFHCVTIYFSDCVGFGKICSEASPYQVVNLLNDLYSIMDDVIESFDCYKVETIGDCYVVASGLPIRNGDNHAGEVASMALQLMTSIDGVSYKHLPGSQVQLRVGINSGPIVAGVVGLKMPRYCLFGDTMNTASRMESGGFALKIHMSEDTYKVLDSLGGYETECRGERQVKGRGFMRTYWLLGKDGADYKLPSQDLALSASQHHFK